MKCCEEVPEIALRLQELAGPGRDGAPAPEDPDPVPCPSPKPCSIPHSVP